MAMDEGGFALPQPLNLKAPQKTEVVDDSSIQCREGSTPVSEVEENVEQKTGDVDNVSPILSSPTNNNSITEPSTDKAISHALNYKEPKWSGAPAYPYTLEVLKDGKIVEEVDVSGSCFVTVGRLPSCDVTCAHPSISRHHVVLQHRPPSDEAGAMFLYDLGGSYGTTVNKVKITPRTYYMLKTGYVIKFGASTRLYIVKGPPEEAFEDEVDMVVEEKNSLADKGEDAKKKKLGILASEEAEIMLEMLKSRNKEIEPDKQEGVNWGFREDAIEEDDGELKLDLNKMSNPAEFKDPKKTLRGYFEREGVDVEFEVTEKGVGRSHQYVCKVELPIDTPAPVFAEGVSSGKKRDAVLACCLHGCKLLDAYGVLRSSHRHEDIESRTEKLAKNDFYDSDEDTFLDRTGEVEHKRKKRMKRAGMEEKSSSRTHDMLSAELKQMNDEIARIESIVADHKKFKESNGDEDALDAFMSASKTFVTPSELKELKKKLFDLKGERVKLENLCDMAKPIPLPQVKKLSSVPKNITTGKVGSVSAPTVFLCPTTPSLSKKIKIDISSSNPSLSNILPDLKTVTASTSENLEKPTKQLTPECPVSSGHPVTISEQPPSTTSVSLSEESRDSHSPADLPMITESLSEDKRSPDIESLPKEHIDVSDENCNRKQTLSEKKSNTAQPSSGKQSKSNRGQTISDAVKWDDDDENLVNWTPPPGQTGDGRTKLNDKFGY